MKIAFLIACNKNPEQINRLIHSLTHENVSIFVHVDKKTNIADKILKDDSVYILPDDLRVNVKWGTFSQVEATLNLIRYTSSHFKYDFYFLISGQDFILKPIKEVVTFFEENRNMNFINIIESKNNNGGKSTNYDKRNEIFYCDFMLQKNRFGKILRRLWVLVTGGYHKTFKVFKRKQPKNFNFYFGSSWWCLNADFINYMQKTISQNSEIVTFFKHSCCPDESFFQSILMNSDFQSKREEYLHYIVWENGKSSPKILTIADYEDIRQTNKLFGRKFDLSIDSEIIDKIEKSLL